MSKYVVNRRGDKWDFFEVKHFLTTTTVRTGAMYCFERNLWVAFSKVVQIGPATRIVESDEAMSAALEKIIHAYNIMREETKRARDIFNVQVELSI